MAYAGRYMKNDIRADEAMVLEQEETAPMYYDFANPKPVAVGATYKRTTVYAGPASSFSPGQVVQFDLPTGTPGAMMDPSQSVVQFTINNTSGTSLTLSQSAYSLIERIDAYHGSQMIASAGKAGLLHNLLLDFQSGPSSCFSTASMLGSADYDVTAATLSQATINNALNVPKGAVIANGGLLTVCLPLVYVFGALCGKAIPISELHQGLRVDIHLAQTKDWGIYTIDPGAMPSIQDVKMQLGTVLLSDSAYTKIARSLDHLYVPSMSYLHAQHSVSPNTATSWQLPFRLASVNTIIIAAYPDANSNAYAGDVTLRTRAAISKWQLRIGSTLVPDQPVSATNGAAETRAELVRAFNALGVADYASKVNGARFANSAFAIAFNTSAFSQSDILFDGRRLDTEHAIFEADSNHPAAFTWHAWALHDVMMEVAQNQLQFAV